jgi:hypothetical protein
MGATDAARLKTERCKGRVVEFKADGVSAITHARNKPVKTNEKEARIAGSRKRHVPACAPRVRGLGRKLWALQYKGGTSLGLRTSIAHWYIHRTPGVCVTVEEIVVKCHLGERGGLRVNGKRSGVKTKTYAGRVIWESECCSGLSSTKAAPVSGRAPHRPLGRPQNSWCVCG